MKKCIFIIINLWLIGGYLFCQNNLPNVFLKDDNNDIIASVLNLEAEKAFEVLQASDHIDDWIKHRGELRAKIIEKAKVSFYPDLPLEYQETGSRQLKGYTIKKILFQTRPSVYATANLYIPDGNGPFPGVVVMMGHSRTGKLVDTYQSIGHTLALNGYVSINIDPWGAGERASEHGNFEYHGANLGASLMNVGETLMGMQITDNTRAVDLLISLPFVDPERIGATGASGGGNQTMWLAAIDDRVKAAVPVVSVGTFQSYVMNSNCICETLIDGLTFTEESSVLGLIAPRALKICNGQKDTNRAFYPREMLRSFEGTRTIYKQYNAGEMLSYQIFDTPHGYFPEIREAMLGWFDLHLKNIGDGTPKKEKSFVVLPEPDLMVFPSDQRALQVSSTAEFCSNQGKLLREKMLSTKHVKAQEKREELRKLLRIPENLLYRAHKLTDSGNWERYILETTSGELLPILLYAPNKSSNDYIVLCNSGGKDEIPEELINNAVKRNEGICIVDLWGTGENISINAQRLDGSLPKFHTLSRSVLWLGKTIQGIWVNQLDVIVGWLLESNGTEKITIDADKETGVAGLLFSALKNKTDKLILRNLPVSYLFDESGNIDYFSMAIHVPDFLKWGDLSLTAALSGSEITIVNPVSISGRELNNTEITTYEAEFNYFRTLLKNRSKINFTQ